MKKLLLPAAFLAGLFLSTGAIAQPQAKAYAPENLAQLDRRDQSRVIEREYSDQSNGKRIPDDQLEFYLDQVRSGWGFSRIKQDISTSLRGSGGWKPGHANHPGHPGQNAGYPGSGGQIRCESDRNRYKECATPFRRSAVLVQQLSRSGCTEGRDWGSRPGMVWVDDGCRAIFAEGRGGHGVVSPGNPAQSYSVTCSSDDGHRRTCAWDGRMGRPVIVDNISRTRCTEGRNWGYDRNAIWVNDGCRARFGAR